MARIRPDKTLEEIIAAELLPKTAQERQVAHVEDFNAFVEHFFNTMGKLPSVERLMVEFPGRTKKTIESEVKIAAIKLEAKGYGVLPKEYLSPEQLAVANSILNLADKRSITKKLQDFEVSPAKFDNWKKNPVFNKYLRERSESMLGDSLPGVHMALIDAAQSGDIQAIKLVYEITGRHTAQSQQTVNVQMMLVGVIEAVQKHVQDPKVIQAIANEMQEISGGVIKGELTNNSG